MIVQGVWRPLKKQEDLLLCPADEILFGGGAGGGKSEGLIGDFLNWYGRYGGKAKGLILRKTYKELGDLIQKSRKILGPLFGQGAFSKSEFTWSLPQGAELKLAYLDTYEDWYNHQGFEYTWMGWDELTQWPGDGTIVENGREIVVNQAYMQMFSRQRGTNPDGSNMPTRRVCTTNPGGPGHRWVKQRFVDISPPNVITKHKIRVETQEGQKIYTKSRCFIPALVSDNFYLRNSEYVGNLAMLNPTQRDMMLYGRWDVVEGQFFHEWDPSVHVVDYFYPDPAWPRVMGGDWGTSDPYCFLWGARSPDGDIYIYRELYGRGDHEPASEVRAKIMSIEDMSGDIVYERYLDSSCFSKLGFETTIAQQFEPIHFEPAHRADKAGALNLLREHFKVVNRRSRLKIMRPCVNLIRVIPELTVDILNRDHYGSNQEDHPVDALIYLLRGSQTPEQLQAMAKFKKQLYDRLQDVGPYGAH